MSSQDKYALATFGIDEIYIHGGLSYSLLEKLYQRAIFSLDAEDNIVLKYNSHDILLVFHKQVPSPSQIYRFLKFLDQLKDKDRFIEDNRLLNEGELFLSIKSKSFVLVTQRILPKDTYNPTTEQG